MKREISDLFVSRVQEKPFFIFEMANNHLGDVNLGLSMIREFSKVSRDFDFNFGFKFQYRDLDTFIHPSYKNRDDIKAIKRFSETRLNEGELLAMKEEVDKQGLISVCTAFDEKSVDLIEKHSFDIIKIGSCSLTDWPLLERVSQTKLPIIASTAAGTAQEIDRLVIFLSNRDKKFALMHCVGEYPTENKNLQLNQIDFLRSRYENVVIGFSTHEPPENYDSIKIAIAKGARFFEKHVALGKNRNNYSANPQEISKWLASASTALEMSGSSKENRPPASEKEKNDLQNYKRGAFVKRTIAQGEKIQAEDFFYAIPSIDNQVLANDISKYVSFIAKQEIKPLEPVLFSNVNQVNIRDKVEKIIYHDLEGILRKANITLPKLVDLEISHHYGIDKFYEHGCLIVNLINRDYCKKFIVLLGGQKHPTHHHRLKEESFIVDYGDVSFDIDGVKKEYAPGEIVLVKSGQRHSFSSNSGCIFEEISTTHYKGDSFYEDPRIMANPERKTNVKLWLDSLKRRQ